MSCTKSIALSTPLPDGGCFTVVRKVASGIRQWRDGLSVRFLMKAEGVVSTPEELYPLVPTAAGVIDPDITGSGRVVYLGAESVTPSSEDYSTAYYRNGK